MLWGGCLVWFLLFGLCLLLYLLPLPRRWSKYHMVCFWLCPGTLGIFSVYVVAFPLRFYTIYILDHCVCLCSCLSLLAFLLWWWIYYCSQCDCSFPCSGVWLGLLIAFCCICSPWLWIFLLPLGIFSLFGVPWALCWYFLYLVFLELCVDVHVVNSVVVSLSRHVLMLWKTIGQLNCESIVTYIHAYLLCN